MHLPSLMKRVRGCILVASILGGSPHSRKPCSMCTLSRFIPCEKSMSVDPIVPLRSCVLKRYSQQSGPWTVTMIRNRPKLGSCMQQKRIQDTKCCNRCAFTTTLNRCTQSLTAILVHSHALEVVARNRQCYNRRAFTCT